ncbi:hypothetical protein RvY_15916 [Ramazzottius varieornatus]|uniref:Uncharacterized protein n=1 Tax=Ramazzottius varieornatus TaxID=947166 RepID=A0A1D1VY11_RAMVA|nr:hypothetical protein RvY_15916 [Ramazzottius varieornatus]
MLLLVFFLGCDIDEGEAGNKAPPQKKRHGTTTELHQRMWHLRIAVWPSWIWNPHCTRVPPASMGRTSPTHSTTTMQFLKNTGRHSAALETIKAASNTLTTKGTLDQDSRITVIAKRTTEYVPDHHGPSELQEDSAASGANSSLSSSAQSNVSPPGHKARLFLVESEMHGETIVRMKMPVQPAKGREVPHKDSLGHRGKVAEETDAGYMLPVRPTPARKPYMERNGARNSTGFERESSR